MNDENNKVSPGCVAHQIRVKVKIVGIISRIQFSIQVYFVPNWPFLGPGSLSGMGIAKL